MTWADFYLICFVVGFAFSFLSFVVGGTHLHLPHLHGVGHVAVGHGAAVGHGPSGGHVSGNGAPANGHGTTHVSPFNFFTVPVFLAWFGGTGFLLSRYSTVWFVFGLVLAIAAGLIGATAVFLFMSRFLMAREKALDPADFDMVEVEGAPVQDDIYQFLQKRLQRDPFRKLSNHPKWRVLKQDIVDHLASQANGMYATLTSVYRDY